MPPRGPRSPTLHSGEENEKWSTSGPGIYIVSAAWGVPNTSERGTKSAIAHKWAGWLHNPCRLGGPQRFKGGDKISSGPQVGEVATYILPPRRSRTLQSGVQD